MKITVCRPDELGVAEVSLWRAWQRADDRLANPFLGPEFAIAMAHHHDAARVAVLSDGNETVGFLPFERHPGGVGRSLAYDLSDFQALIGPRELEWNPTDVLAGCKLAVFEFDHLIGHQADAWAPRNVSYHGSPVVDLSGELSTWQEKRASSGQMKTFLRRERRMAREWGDLNFEFDSRSEADLEQLMRWKGAQYVRTGRVNRFARRWFRELVIELFHTHSEHFSLGLARLQAGQRTVALDLSPRANNVLSAWFPTYDPAAGAYSPGIASLLSLIRIGRDEGLTRIELGSGEHAYKNLFADYEDRVAEGVSERPVRAAALRRIVTAPRRIATNVVLSSPRLRVAARETLAKVGRLRARLS